MNLEVYSDILGSSNAPPLIMLHGWNQTSDNLYTLATLLEDIRVVHVLDLPGFGKSKIPQEALAKNNPWSSLDYARVIIQYMDKHELKEADFLGHSFGARVCIQLCANYSNRISQLILVGAAGIPAKKSIRTKYRRARITLIRNLVEMLKHVNLNTYEKALDKFINKFGSRDYKSAGILRNILVKAVNENLTTEISRINRDTLLIWGENDSETPVDIGLRMADLLSNSRIIVLPNKAHFPFERLGSHLCAYHIRNFLK